MNDRNSLSVAALVLAGGKSSRMGRDKALIVWHGLIILQRICQVASECCQQVYILTPWPDRYRAIISEEYQFLLEVNSGNGPLVGLADGLAQVNSDWLLLLACDMPLLESTVIRNWISELYNIPENILALVPKQADRWEPLCAFYRKEALPELQLFIDRGGRSFQAWFERIPVQAIAVGEREAKMLSNCNTYEDLDKLSNLNQDCIWK